MVLVALEARPPRLTPFGFVDLEAQPGVAKEIDDLLGERGGFAGGNARRVEVLCDLRRPKCVSEALEGRGASRDIVLVIVQIAPSAIGRRCVLDHAETKSARVGLTRDDHCVLRAVRKIGCARGGHQSQRESRQPLRIERKALGAEDRVARVEDAVQICREQFHTPLPGRRGRG